jgi:hypothetical protein
MSIWFKRLLKYLGKYQCIDISKYNTLVLFQIQNKFEKYEYIQKAIRHIYVYF